MTNQQIKDLIERNLEIQKEIQLLSKESLEISQTLALVIDVNKGSKKDNENKVINVLETKGYKVLKKNVKSNNILEVSKGAKKYSILYKFSKYYSNNDYHAWYTIKENVENFIDFFIFQYNVPNQSSYCIVVDKSTMKNVINLLKKMPDGRTHINLRIINEKIIETTSKIDLTEYSNNFDCF